MNSGKTLMLVGAGLAILVSLCFIGFGLLAVWGSFSANSRPEWSILGPLTACMGILLLGGGIALIYFASRSKAGAAAQNITLKVDLPGDVNLDTMKCKSCGGALTMDNIQMVAGAPVVSCPYCKTTYQLTEEPKW